ncbi:hypothetical protein ASZ90_001822 [hydrocarbon metagenome]|uniref:Uncharacterized protein n=1 Tax=hydrocarbon metagenome TaxID=938273 RepID=A0A0W8G5E8_9ZZZZ
MLTALALIGAALAAAAAALLYTVWRARRRPRLRCAHRETLSRRFNFDRYKRYEHK